MKITEEMKNLAHAIHGEEIRIATDERLHDKDAEVEDYCDLLLYAHDIADKVLGC